MMFLNPMLLIGLAAMGIPIVVHLLNRRRAVVVHWGAMRFLNDSMSARRRRVLLEEILLMILRCLVVALLALAMARAYVPTASVVPWALVLPAILLAAVAVGVATAMWSARWTRTILLVVAGVLIAGAASAAMLEKRLQTGRWAAGSGSSVVIVLDGSTSMTLMNEGLTNYERGNDEACALVRRLPAGDSVTVLLAAEAVRVVGGEASVRVSDKTRDTLCEALQSTEAPGGSLNVTHALQSAADILARERSAARRVILITDPQATGWHGRDEVRWRALAAALQGPEGGRKPEILCRRMAPPTGLDNLAVTHIATQSQIIGTDRAVVFEVVVQNTGVAPVSGAGLSLEIENRRSQSETVPQLAAGQAATVRFVTQFDHPGTYVARANIIRDDDLPGDNENQYLVQVLETMPVLIIQDPRPADGLEDPGDLVALAMSPQAQAWSKATATRTALIDPKMISTADSADMTHFNNYRMVVLADVARLPAETAAALASYVSAGGGLWVLPGARADARFYNNWLADTDAAVLPATLDKRVVDVKNPARPAVRTFEHPALAWVGRLARCDAGEALVQAWWQLTPRKETATEMNVGARLDNQLPLLVEHRLGKGRVLLWAISLQAGQTTWPGLKSFVPMVHELTYEVAAASGADVNVSCGSEMNLELPLRASAAGKASASVGRVAVSTPSGREMEASSVQTGHALVLSFTGADEPGLYTFNVPKPVADLYEMPTPGSEEVRAVAMASPGESVLTGMTDAQRSTVAKYVRIIDLPSDQELFRAAAGEVPGQELWRTLVLAAVIVLLIEMALSRFITWGRGGYSASNAEFHADAIDLETFRSETAADKRPPARTTVSV